MKMSYALLALLTLVVWGSFTPADENKFATIQKICRKQKKSAPACGCIVKNLRDKFRNGKLSDQQLIDAVAVYQTPASAADYMADLITGLEYHCVENSNYSGG